LNAADDIKSMAASGAKKAVDTLEAKREQVADALDAAAATVDNQSKRAAEPVKGYAAEAQDRIESAAGYVRDHDVQQIGSDAMQAAKAYPIASVIALGAVVLGGGMLLAALLREEAAGGSSRPSLFVSAADGLGPKATGTIIKMRDAAVGFALARAVDALEDKFPGFREHFEKS
jgi:hypothetical protein